MGFLGYCRPDGSVGIRNHVVVMSSTSCANGVVNAIGRELPEVKLITHIEGCRNLVDFESTNRTLIGLANNPNVAALLIVGLGCELFTAHKLAAQITPSGKPVESLLIQETGGSVKTTEHGVAICQRLLNEAAQIPRQEYGWDRLTLALECGGSDALSGITSNPVIGVAADWLVEAGGSAILSETTEMIGTERILTRRARNPTVAEHVRKLIQKQENVVRELMGSLTGYATVGPAHMEGGLSSVQEKALGTIVKAGTSPINEVVKYGAPRTQKGLVIMDSPGSDIFSLTGMAASGAQVAVFSTGNGTPAGFPIMPVIKVSSNTELFQRMQDDIDVDAGIVLSGATVEQAGYELVSFIKDVANGTWTKAETNRQDILAIHVTREAL